MLLCTGCGTDPRTRVWHLVQGVLHFDNVRRSYRLAALTAVVGVGLVAGVGVFTFGYARGYAYLTNDPAACANCHIMSEHFGAWMKSSHREVATCNDCHAPHDVLGKYVTKARNGFWHSFYFTVGRYPDPLRVTPRNRAITEGACRYCHADIVDAIEPAAHNAHGSVAAAGDLSRRSHAQDSCIRCHTYAGHFVR